jgi:HSP20 family protein
MIRDLLPVTRRSQLSTRNDPILSLRRDMDRLFEDFTTDLGAFRSPLWERSLDSFTPRLDMEDRDDKIILTAELPGMSDKDVQVELNKDYLTMKGEKKSTREEKSSERYVSERSFGAFERTIRLPADVMRDKIDAVVKDGILTISLPKSPEAKKEVKKVAVHH